MCRTSRRTRQYRINIVFRAVLFAFNFAEICYDVSILICTAPSRPSSRHEIRTLKGRRLERTSIDRAVILRNLAVAPGDELRIFGTASIKSGDGSEIDCSGAGA